MNKPKGCALAAAALAGLIAVPVVVWVLWVLLHSAFRPHYPLEAPLQQIISSAAVSDTYDYGWASTDVTDVACPLVSPAQLDQMDIEKRPGDGLGGDEPASTTTWVLMQDTNFFVTCQTHSIRSLWISITADGQCRARVTPMPTCDP